MDTKKGIILVKGCQNGYFRVFGYSIKKKIFFEHSPGTRMGSEVFPAEGIASHGSGKDNVYIRVNSLIQWLSNLRVH